MNYKKMNETQRINAAAIMAYSLITVLLQAAYILELVKGKREIGYIVVFTILNLLPYGICIFTYVKDKATKHLKYIMSIGFAALYVYVLITAAVPVTFVYIFLMLIISIPYGEKKVCFVTGLIAILSNIASVIIGFVNGSLTTDDLALVEIQLISIFLASMFTYFATSVISKVNAQKMDEIHEEKEKTEELLERTLDVSKGISEDIAVVSERMKELEKTVVTTKDSMQDVSYGANETAQSMQEQLMQTSEIVSQVNKTKEVSRTISEDMVETEEAIATGKENIKKLLEFVEQSEEISGKVATRMKELSHNMEQLNSIVEMINFITNQTSLLSLNASIEAARAGEAGRGFTVVAGEISGLAGQTRTATVDITKLIEETTLSIEEVFRAINQLVESNNEQNQAAQKMAVNFEAIEAHTNNISEVSQALEEVVNELDKSNKGIIDGIDNVSAVTEEVSARATETLYVSENNAQAVEDITSVIVELNKKAQKLHE